MWRRGSLLEQQSCQRDVRLWLLAEHSAYRVSVRLDPSWRTYEVNGGHHIMIDEPDRLTEILLEVA